MQSIFRYSSQKIVRFVLAERRMGDEEPKNESLTRYIDKEYKRDASLRAQFNEVCCFQRRWGE